MKIEGRQVARLGDQVTCSCTRSAKHEVETSDRHRDLGASATIDLTVPTA